MDMRRAAVDTAQVLITLQFELARTDAELLARMERDVHRGYREAAQLARP